MPRAFVFQRLTYLALVRHFPCKIFGVPLCQLAALVGVLTAPKPSPAVNKAVAMIVFAFMIVAPLTIRFIKINGSIILLLEGGEINNLYVTEDFIGQ